MIYRAAGSFATATVPQFCGVAHNIAAASATELIDVKAVRLVQDRSRIL
jgi:hypothetical protein